VSLGTEVVEKNSSWSLFFYGFFNIGVFVFMSFLFYWFIYRRVRMFPSLGAMLFAASDEIIPESHKRGVEREATFGLIAGVVIMILLDRLFA
jgi:ZIP family zinc transporter